ncbi:MAG TPA: beta-ketoacyl-[acyl-carrier-protein] synthase family protein [Candidatus Bathyarchaeia archaeon]|nr:beta-ketoacyl-[acyl-carrier-protein] synthase family protein [Candidatus Bathyarchaeia archaeon]
MPGAEPNLPPSPDIVVSGVGAVTPFGWGAPVLWKSLRRGVAAIGSFGRFDASRHRTQLAGEVPLDFAPSPPSRRASLADRFAVAAAREAIAAARLDLDACRERTGVFFGSSTGGMLESEWYYEALIRRGSRRARPGLLASQQLNGPGDAVARDIGATGPVETVSSACASGAMAVGAAFRALRRGDADVALAGGSDSLCQLTYAGFNALRAVAPGPSRPFRADREGLTLGEGAGVLVLETGEHARRRGAVPIAGLAGEGSSCDAQHMTAPHSRGAGVEEAIRLALADAGVEPAEVDFVNAHGTGTPLNDAAEAAAIRAVFGDRAGSIPVTSTKALIGHLLGSAGAVEAVATVLCLARAEVHPMPRGGEPDAALGLDLVLGAPRPLGRAQCAVSTSLAFGGANAALVFRRTEEA